MIKFVNGTNRLAPTFCRHFVGLVFISIFVFAGIGTLNAQTIASDPNLDGIPGPYRMANFCLTASNIMWIGGGYGDAVKVSSATILSRYRFKQHGEPIEAVNGFYAIDRGPVWAVGYGGAVFYSSDNGASWKQQESGTDLKLAAVTCIGSKRCWITGDDGLILSTMDGGESWRRIYTGVDDNLSAIEFANEMNGWIVGDEGLVLVTADGGATWTERRVRLRSNPEVREFGYSDLLAVRFVSKRVGWVAGWHGIARTMDGGKTWQATELWDGAFVGLVSQDGRNVWAINRGDNYCSNDSGATWWKCKGTTGSTRVVSTK